MTSSERAKKIADQLDTLAEEARDAGLGALTYLIEMARMEAFDRAEDDTTALIAARLGTPGAACERG